jgi:hypothetical protein
MARLPVQEWSELVESRVEIPRDGQKIDQGLVELVGCNDTVLWLAADGTDRRRLYSKVERYAVSLDQT